MFQKESRSCITQNKSKKQQIVTTTKYFNQLTNLLYPFLFFWAPEDESLQLWTRFRIRIVCKPQHHVSIAEFQFVFQKRCFIAWQKYYWCRRTTKLPNVIDDLWIPWSWTTHAMFRRNNDRILNVLHKISSDLWFYC